MTSTARPNLVVLVDGVPMAEAAARELWGAFSRHMDEHRGDLAGFARAQGWFSVSPEYRGGQAVLVVQTAEGAPTKPSVTTQARGHGDNAAPRRRPKPKR